MMSRVSLLVISFMRQTVERSFSLVKQVFASHMKSPSRASSLPHLKCIPPVGASLLALTILLTPRRPKPTHGVSSRVLRIRPFCEPYAVAFQTLFAAQTAQFSADRRCRDHSRSEEHTSELQSLRHLVCRL